MTRRNHPKDRGDLRAYARTTQTRLILGGLILILVLGVGLIYLIYDLQAALLGLVCILVGLGPIALIVLWLSGFEKIVERWRSRE